MCWSTASNSTSVTIVGPVADDPSWQARSDDGFTKSQFLVDWDRQVVTCPAGKQSISWLPNTWPENGMMFEARFARKDCTPCPLRSRCTGPKTSRELSGCRRANTTRRCNPLARHQTTKEFRQNYAARAGIEGTHAQAISRCGLRQMPIYRVGQDPSAARDHRRCRQSGQDRRLAQWHPSSQDATAHALPPCRWLPDPVIEFATSVNIRVTRCKVAVMRSESPCRDDV